MTVDNKQGMLTECMKFWRQLEDYYSELSKIKFDKHYEYNIGDFIFNEISGFSHVHNVIKKQCRDSMRKGEFLHTLCLARPGYRPNKKNKDFEEDKQIIAEIARVKAIELNLS